jgi:ribosomal protein S15P/S13E
MIQKSDLLKKYRLHEKDTGSTLVQLILLQEVICREINHLNRNRKISKHFNFKKQKKKENYKDIPPRRALLKNLAKKEKLLKYLDDPNTYQQLRQDLDQFQKSLVSK